MTTTYRVTLGLDGPPSSDEESFLNLVDDFLTNLLREAPGMGPVVCSYFARAGCDATIALDAADAALAVFTATRIVDRALVGVFPARIVSVEAGPFDDE